MRGRRQQQKKKVKQARSHFAIEQNGKKNGGEEEAAHVSTIVGLCMCAHERTRKKTLTKQQKWRKRTRKKAI